MNLMSGEPIISHNFEVVSTVCLLNLNLTPFSRFDQYWRSKFVLLVE